MPGSQNAPPFAASPVDPGASRDPAAQLPVTTPKALGPFFWLAAHAPSMTRQLQPLVTRLTPVVSGRVRRETTRNAARIFGRVLGEDEQRRFTRSVVKNFYEFVTDIGTSVWETRDQLVQRIESVEGEAAYMAARASRRGAVLVTAHMGSFEVGLAALARVERRIRVVFKRDASGPFEAMRARLRDTLGVIETPIDDGMSSWMELRDALLNDDVVVMQGDRAIPGQRSEVVPCLHGHLRIPSGPARLAAITESPIVPVFTVRLRPGRFHVHLHSPIQACKGCCESEGASHAVRAIGRAIEEMVRKYPEQWLALEAAFEEDSRHG